MHDLIRQRTCRVPGAPVKQQREGNKFDDFAVNNTHNPTLSQTDTRTDYEMFS